LIVICKNLICSVENKICQKILFLQNKKVLIIFLLKERKDHNAYA